jgi:hypothetical protein
MKQLAVRWLIDLTIISFLFLVLFIQFRIAIELYLGLLEKEVLKVLYVKFLSLLVIFVIVGSLLGVRK